MNLSTFLAGRDAAQVTLQNRLAELEQRQDLKPAERRVLAENLNREYQQNVSSQAARVVTALATERARLAERLRDQRADRERMRRETYRDIPPALMTVLDRRVAALPVGDLAAWYELVSDGPTRAALADLIDVHLLTAADTPAAQALRERIMADLADQRLATLEQESELLQQQEAEIERILAALDL